jgi:cellulase
VQQNTSIALDWNFHWIHQTNSSTSCTISGGGVDPTLCPDEATCAQNCAIEGANYTSSGISTSGDALTPHQYVTNNGVTSNASPRVYLVGDDGDYVSLQLLGQELRFDVDISTLVCGENGALYLSEMDHTGGRTQNNPGGANFGSGYCDAQCPIGTWINGTLNTDSKGACCNEMDIWEANANATALTPHPCEGNTCDSSGCGFNPYALGDQTYYGNGDTVDTLQPFSVITQFYTDDNTTSGSLTEIRRLYIRNGQIIQNAVSSSGLDSITADWCTSTDSSAASLGGLTTMGEALGRGMVLVFSIWNDNSQYMNWLDCGSSGPCDSSAGDPATIEAQTPGTYMTWSNTR